MHATTPALSITPRKAARPFSASNYTLSVNSILSSSPLLRVSIPIQQADSSAQKLLFHQDSPSPTPQQVAQVELEPSAIGLL